MQNFLQEMILNNVFTFVLILTRIGTVISIMPGIGDSYVPHRVRILFAMGFSFILTPIISMHVSAPPNSALQFGLLIITEAMIGIFIGLVMKIMLSALNVAGAIASVQSGLANAQVFNPAENAQGSIIGAVYSLVGVVMIMVTDFHHYMLKSAVYSYEMFPTNTGFPDIGSMTEAISMCVNTAFKVGVEIALPFIIVVTLLHIGMGLLGRLMPQMQIFFVAIPIQITLTLIILITTISYGTIYWLNEYETLLTNILS